jgi:predicted GIY-YIG superfamily endonuclease
LVDRLLRHNEGRNKYTKEGGEWKLLWSGIKETRSAAVRLESILKKYGREQLREFVEKYQEGQVEEVFKKINW